MERRAFADGSVDEIRPSGFVLRIDVRLDGNAEYGGRIRVFAENGLAADDDNLVVIRDIRGGADDVFEIATPHRAVARSLKDRGVRDHPRHDETVIGKAALFGEAMQVHSI